MKFFLAFLLIILFVYITYLYIAAVEWLLKLDIDKQKKVKKTLPLREKTNEIHPRILTVAIKRNNNLCGYINWKQAQQSVVVKFIQSSFMVNMDSLYESMGTSSDESSFMGGVHKKPSEVEQIEFERAVWNAFAQCFITYKEANDAIDKNRLGLL